MKKLMLFALCMIAGLCVFSEPKPVDPKVKAVEDGLLAKIGNKTALKASINSVTNLSERCRLYGSAIRMLPAEERHAFIGSLAEGDADKKRLKYLAYRLEIRDAGKDVSKRMAILSRIDPASVEAAELVDLKVGALESGAELNAIMAANPDLVIFAVRKWSEKHATIAESIDFYEAVITANPLKERNSALIAHAINQLAKLRAARSAGSELK